MRLFHPKVCSWRSTTALSGSVVLDRKKRLTIVDVLDEYFLMKGVGNGSLDCEFWQSDS